MDIEDAIIEQKPYKKLLYTREFLDNSGLNSLEVEIGEYSWCDEPVLEVEATFSSYNNCVGFYKEDELRKIHEVLSKAIEAIDNYGKEDKVQEQTGTADS